MERHCGSCKYNDVGVLKLIALEIVHNIFHNWFHLDLGKIVMKNYSLQIA